VVYEDEQLTYAQLNRRANQLAHYLRGQHVQAGTIVALLLERSIELTVGILGALKAGAVYLPIDPSYPLQRIQYILEGSQPKLLLTQRNLFDRVLPTTYESIILDECANDIARLPDENAPTTPLLATTDTLAYVIYTSGSTGSPKGVAATMSATLNRLMAQSDFDPYRHGDVCCQKTAIGFVDSIFETLGPLLHGVPLIIAPPAIASDPSKLADLLAQRGVTRLVTVPSMARALLETKRTDRMQGLRSWTLSGESLSPLLLASLRERLPNCQFINLYGTSEVAADATCYLSTGDHGTTVPIGRPMRNTRVYILGRTMQPVPVGAVGELYVGGAGVAQGYLNKPELTAERFFVDPFATNRNERMYKTGDLGRWRDDGNIEYLGRNDDQVKIRGVRIELGEIEACLRRFADVSDCTVAMRPVAADEDRLVAYVVCGSKAAAS
jgi:amino acid adenylation domain-containing protein